LYNNVRGFRNQLNKTRGANNYKDLFLLFKTVCTLFATLCLGDVKKIVLVSDLIFCFLDKLENMRLKRLNRKRHQLITFLIFLNQTGFNERRHSKRWLLAQVKVAKLLLTHATRLSFEETHSHEKIQTGHTRVAGEVSFCRGQFEVPNDKRFTN
jgi:hypothetical protein